MKDRLLRKGRPLIASPLEWQMASAPVPHPVIPVLAERGGTQLEAPRLRSFQWTRENRLPSISLASGDGLQESKRKHSRWETTL